jgi:hypothetical protein
MLIDLTRAAILPALAAGVGATLKWSIQAAGARRKRLAPPPVSQIILPPGIRLLPPPSAPPRRMGVLPLLGMLPPVPRRTNPWKAAAAGGLGFGVGIAGYFRTKTDVAIGVTAAAALFVVLGTGPEDEAADWQLALIYAAMALMALYSALRAVSSNRLRERMPRRSFAERRQILLDEVDALTAEGWRVESVGDYEAIIARVARPNHVLHAVISFFTSGLWIPVWLLLTRARRRNLRWSYYRFFVDHTGACGKEAVPAPSGSGDAVVDVTARRAPALDQQMA